MSADRGARAIPKPTASGTLRVTTPSRETTAKTARVIGVRKSMKPMEAVMPRPPLNPRYGRPSGAHDGGHPGGDLHAQVLIEELRQGDARHRQGDLGDAHRHDGPVRHHLVDVGRAEVRAP